MDVLVKWQDGTMNVVCSSELKAKGPLCIGSSVKMLYMKKWYLGTILDVQDENYIESDDSDNIPLNKIRERIKSDLFCSSKNNDCESEDNDIPVNQVITNSNNTSVQSSKTHLVVKNNNVSPEDPPIDDSPIPSPEYDSDRDPPFGICEARRCKAEVFSSCHVCDILLCWEHFIADTDNCLRFGHGMKSLHITAEIDISDKGESVEQDDFRNLTKATHPEHFLVDGNERENPGIKEKKINIQKQAKKLRDCGQEYLSPHRKKNVSARIMKPRCMSEKCSKNGKKCPNIDDKQRKHLFDSYYLLANLTRQRDFLIHHVTKQGINRKTVTTESRRTCTLKYFFTVSHNRLPVCKKFFLNTLGISERSVRTALYKTTELGMLEKEKRGGRQRCEEVLKKEEKMRNEINIHIDRYPKMESHYCRAKSLCMYLHPDLTLQRMYDMFIEDLKLRNIQGKPSITTYRNIFKSKNLSFYHPKKDQCSLCASFRDGDEKVQQELKEVFENHINEKKKVRELKKEFKEASITDNTTLSGVFDLQQVIYLPISKESALFYKSRLSNFNFTFYDLGSKDCHCFVWHEAAAKRGSSGIATCIFKVLEEYCSQGKRKVVLFSDGCYGQNKNSIVVAMLLYAVCVFPQLMEISLRFFVTNHGQNEGDSAHSSISHAIMKAGDILEPTQLLPIINLARRRQPYKVHPMTFRDFLDFKTLSKNLRILSIRTTASGRAVNWTDIMEVKVDTLHPDKIFFKTSHLTEEYDIIQLKRGTTKNEMKVNSLYASPINISYRKYKDLVSLSNGKTPIIRLPEVKAFYENLPHENT